MQRPGLLLEQVLRIGLPVLLLAIASWEGMGFAQTPEDLQRQAQEMERAVAACGSDLGCLAKAAQRANELMKDLQKSPEIAKLVNTPCPGFDAASFPSSAGPG